ncbi:MAG: beta-lactamase family protein [Verrucomicrobiales bacterium]|nr:beta-lactamase family protein [Verrucomicrobiales bacterium]
MAAFLRCRLVPQLGNPWDYVFEPGPLPALAWDHPERVRAVAGSYPLTVRWFDGEGREVRSAEAPGRYGYYAEGRTTSGQKIRRGGTLFCRPKAWDGWSERLRAVPDFIPLDGLAPSAWDRHRDAIADYAGRSLLLSILKHQEGAILMAWLHELPATEPPDAGGSTPAIRDQEYHLTLKRRLLGIEGRYPALQLPGRVAGVEAPVLQAGREVDAGFRPGTVERLRTVCREWFEGSREPFNVVVARRGRTILDASFGAYAWGPLTPETPSEIASITKLVTGMLFARFVDQGLLGIDDPVGLYLPDFPVTGTNVLTLRHCFTHATALDGHEEWGGLHNPWLENVVALAGPALHPGRIHNYNGMGYDLAGRVMEVVSGKSVFRLVREHLFEPLGMSRTSLQEDLGFGCFSTAGDLAKLGQMLLNQGAYGDRLLFQRATFGALLPQPLQRFYPGIADVEWGIGLTWMRQPPPEAGTNGIPREATLLGRNVVGHGSATAAILRVDLDNDVVIAQSRRRAGPDYEKHWVRFLRVVDEGLESKR